MRKRECTIESNRKDKLKNLRDKVLRKVKQEGLICAVIQWIYHLIKKIFFILVFRKKEKLNDIEAKRWIFEEWKKEWLFVFDKFVVYEREKYFFKLFIYDYEDTCKKLEKNKKMNFLMKFVIVGTVIGITIFFLLATVIYNVIIEKKFSTLWEFIEEYNWSWVTFGTVLYVVVVGITVTFAKWLDVKKYQETWMRHSKHKFILDMEMYKFIARVDEYASKDEDIIKLFQKNIEKSWLENQKKFEENMKKEKDIGDIAENIKKKI